MKKPIIQTKAGSPIKAGEVTIQPVSQSFSWITNRFGFVWNRPYAIRVDDGETTRQIAIVDRTRIALILLWGLSVFFSLIAVWKLLTTWRNTND